MTEKAHKFVVRSKENDISGDYSYLRAFDTHLYTFYEIENATKFDTREEAQGWANSHQVVVEIDEDGNEPV